MDFLWIAQKPIQYSIINTYVHTTLDKFLSWCKNTTGILNRDNSFATMCQFSGEVTNVLKHYQPEIQQKNKAQKLSSKQGRFLWRRVSTSESQNDCQFDELNGQEAMHKWKVKLSKQLFCHFEQHLQGMFNLNGKFGCCFYYLRRINCFCDYLIDTCQRNS